MSNRTTVAANINSDENCWRLKKAGRMLKSVLFPLSHHIHTAVLCGSGKKCYMKPPELSRRLRVRINYSQINTTSCLQFL